MRSVKRLIVLLVLFLPTFAHAGNTATCVLDKMPGVQNDATAAAIYQLCVREHGALLSVDPGSGRGWFSYESGVECAADKAKETSSQRGAMMIRVSCNRLYDKPLPELDFDPYTAKPSILDGMVPLKGNLDREK